jgi:ribose transport system ATP-binding protein
MTVAQQVATGRTVGAEVPALAVRGLSKSFAGTLALDALDLEIAPGEIHALLGENGSGKSTLIKILSGYHRPDGGTVTIAGDELPWGESAQSYALGCRFIHQDLGLIDTMSVVDNMLFGAGYPTRASTVRSDRALRVAREDLARVGIDLDPHRLIGELTLAERTGVAIARALHHDAAHETKLLVLDEPTATLPEREVIRLLEIVRAVAGSGAAVLYVTHRLDEVPALAHRVTVLRDGRKVATASAKGISRHELVSMLVGDEFEEAAAEAASLSARGDPTLRVSGLAAGRIASATIDFYPGEVTGIAGLMGSGRESLLRAIFGAIPRRAGTVTVGERELAGNSPFEAISAGMGYVPAERKIHGGVMTLTARENITLTDLRPVWRPPVISRRREERESREWFARLSIRPEGRIEQDLDNFSGGNQQKIVLSKWLRRRPAVILLDEPTQGVDIGSKAEIHRHLLAEAGRGATVVVASIDVDELAAICSRVLVVRGGQVVAEIPQDKLTPSRLTAETLGTEEGVA